MRRFAQLVDQLDFFSAADDKVRLLAEYLRSTSDPERGYGVGLLLGTAGLKRASMAALKDHLKARIGEARFDLLTELASDQVETLALGWPSTHPSNGAPVLSDLIVMLSSTDKDEHLSAISAVLDHIEVTERWALIKCLTGRPPGGLTPHMVRQALAQLGGTAEGEVAQVWHGRTPPYLDLFSWADGGGPRPDSQVSAAFRSFLPPQTITKDELSTDPAEHCLCAWEPPGLVVQIVATDEEMRLYTCDGDDVSALFPELFDEHRARRSGASFWYLTLPEGDGFQPTAIVKQRASRLRHDKKLMQSFPANLVGFNPEAMPSAANSRLRVHSVFSAADTDELERLIAAENPDRPAWAQGLLIFEGDTIWPSRRLAFNPRRLRAVLLYAEFAGGAMKSLTVGAWREGELLPIGKADTPRDELVQVRLAEYIGANTVERFGPVREVTHRSDAGLVLDISFSGVEPAPRRKAGLVLNDIVVEGIVENERPSDAVHLDDLQPAQ